MLLWANFYQIKFQGISNNICLNMATQINVRISWLFDQLKSFVVYISYLLILWWKYTKTFHSRKFIVLMLKCKTKGVKSEKIEKLIHLLAVYILCIVSIVQTVSRTLQRMANLNEAWYHNVTTSASFIRNLLKNQIHITKRRCGTIVSETTLHQRRNNIEVNNSR